MLGEKCLDPREGSHEPPGEVGKRGRANEHEQHDVVTDDGGLLVRLVPDASIMAEGNPAAAADLGQPILVWGGGLEMVRMPLDDEARGPENLRELLPEIAIGEIDAVGADRFGRGNQAARS